jgi:hypothetical protein
LVVGVGSNLKFVVEVESELILSLAAESEVVDLVLDSAAESELVDPSLKFVVLDSAAESGVVDLVLDLVVEVGLGVESGLTLNLAVEFDLVLK